MLDTQRKGDNNNWKWLGTLFSHTSVTCLCLWYRARAWPDDMARWRESLARAVHIYTLSIKDSSLTHTGKQRANVKLLRSVQIPILPLCGDTKYPMLCFGYSLQQFQLQCSHVFDWKHICSALNCEASFCCSPFATFRHNYNYILSHGVSNSVESLQALAYATLCLLIKTSQHFLWWFNYLIHLLTTPTSSFSPPNDGYQIKPQLLPTRYIIHTYIFDFNDHTYPLTLDFAVWCLHYELHVSAISGL